MTDERGLSAFDLVAPQRTLMPQFGAAPPPRPLYVPAPHPTGTARIVIVGGDYDEPRFSDLPDGFTPWPYAEDVFVVPQEQRDRWAAAQEAFDAMQEEIAALIEQRRQS